MKMELLLVALLWPLSVCGFYFFGLVAARRQRHNLLLGKLERCRQECARQHRIIYEQDRDLIERNHQIQHLQQALDARPAPAIDDHFTLLRAAKELRLAAKTFVAMTSHDHARTAAALADACLAIAQRFAPAQLAERPASAERIDQVATEDAA